MSKHENENENEKTKNNSTTMRLRTHVNQNVHSYAWRLKKLSTERDDIDKVNLKDVVTTALTIHKILCYENIEVAEELIQQLKHQDTIVDRVNFVNSFKHYDIGEIENKL